MARPKTPIGDFDTDYEEQQYERGLGAVSIPSQKAKEDDDVPGLDNDVDPEEPDEGRDFASRKKKGGVTFARSQTRLGKY